MPDPSQDHTEAMDANHPDPEPEPDALSEEEAEDGSDAQIQKLCEEYSRRDPREMFATIETFLRNHLVCDEHHYTILTLWTVHTWCFECFPSTPYLDIRSPESQSGKTLCLDLLHTLSPGCWLATGPSPGAVAGVLLGDDRLMTRRPIDLEETEEEDQDEGFRPIHSTFLLDDCHHTFGPSERQPLLAQLNSGSRQSCRYATGFDRFCLFGPKAFAGNAPLPRSLASRCIPIILRRKKPSEHVSRFPADGLLSMPDGLFPWLIAWTVDHRDALTQAARQAPSQLPANLTPRQQDCAEPLLHIADSVGGNWSDRARAAIVAVFGLVDGSLGVQLLADIRTSFFMKDNPEYLTTADLLADLVNCENRPWSSWPPNPLKSGRRLGALLGPFGINSNGIKIERDKGQKGYRLRDFQDTWDRYLPPLTVGNVTETSSVTSSVTDSPLVVNELGEK